MLALLFPWAFGVAVGAVGTWIVARRVARRTLAELRATWVEELRKARR